jgi:hypothetical protein
MQTYLVLNHGRWIVPCGNCPGAYAEDKLPEDGKCIFCHEPLEVVYPSKQFRASVDAVVAGRPEENQNWEPGETVNDLKADNIVHAVDNP